MQMPPLLAERIEEARAAMLSNEKWYLLPGYRYQIYCALEPEPDSNPSQPEAHWSDTRRRTQLGILATRQVLPIWEQSWPKFASQDGIIWPDLKWPHSILKMAERVSKDEMPPEQIQEVLSHNLDNWEMLEGLLSRNQNDEFQRCMNVALTAYTTLSLCSNDDSFSMTFNSSNLDWRTIDIDWSLCDPTHWAVMAYAGFTWDENFDRKKSREFWTWWLDEAVPQAWRAVQNP
jgi:hypothetical protein